MQGVSFLSRHWSPCPHPAQHRGHRYFEDCGRDRCCWTCRQMALLPANKDLISRGMKEFNVLLNQQVFEDPLISENDMVTVVDDWVNFYINYYKQSVTGEPQEKDRALQELRQELTALGRLFLDKYGAFLKSCERPDHANPSS